MTCHDISWYIHYNVWNCILLTSSMHFCSHLSSVLSMLSSGLYLLCVSRTMLSESLYQAMSLSCPCRPTCRYRSVHVGLRNSKLLNLCVHVHFKYMQDIYNLHVCAYILQWVYYNLLHVHVPYIHVHFCLITIYARAWYFNPHLLLSKVRMCCVYEHQRKNAWCII